MPVAKKNNNKKKLVNPTSIAVSAAVLVGVLLLLGIAIYNVQLRPVSGDTRSRLVQVPQLSTRTLAVRLKSQGLIRSVTAFRLLAKTTMLLEKCGGPKAGYYDLSPSMSSEEILTRICKGQVAKRKVTFPEGFTIKQMAGRLETELKLPANDFLAAAQGWKVSRDVGYKLSRGSLEGYLFPTTYSFPVGEKPEFVVGEMAATLNQVFVKPNQDAIRKNELSLHQLITLASLVEREARVEAERPLIAGVLMNRLKKKMLLQCDATVQYALGNHKARLLYSDLKVASPYNTYRHLGLPPGPICNPGLPSLLAALHPQSSPYLFYVARPNGTHIFTSTYSEHQQAIKQARRS